MPRGTRECQKCHLNRQERFFSSSRARFCADCLAEARRRAAKDRRLRLTYGITLDEYEALLEAQRAADGEIHCAGCNETRQSNYKWSVDHDHAVEREYGSRASVRGIVCRRCNKVLRDVRDSHEVLSNLVNYVLWARDRTQRLLSA